MFWVDLWHTLPGDWYNCQDIPTVFYAKFSWWVCGLILPDRLNIIVGSKCYYIFCKN